MLSKKISVKKLFIFLLAAILAMVLLFFLHGPYLEPGVEEAVSQAVLSQAEPQAGQAPAEGHRVFLTEQDGDVLTVYGVFCYGCYAQDSGVLLPETCSQVVPARIILEKENEGLWNVVSYEEPESGTQSDSSMRELFPFLPRTLLSLFGDRYNDLLAAQMETYAQQGNAAG